MLWKVGLSKNKLHWNMIFLELSGNIIFLFPKTMILFFRRKMKDRLFQTNTWKYDIFCIFGKDGISFSYKYDITILSKKQR